MHEVKKMLAVFLFTLATTFLGLPSFTHGHPQPNLSPRLERWSKRHHLSFEWQYISRLPWHSDSTQVAPRCTWPTWIWITRKSQASSDPRRVWLNSHQLQSLLIGKNLNLVLEQSSPVDIPWAIPTGPVGNGQFSSGTIPEYQKYLFSNSKKLLSSLILQ